MKTSKTFKKVSALVLALVMLFSLTLSAVADTPQTATDIVNQINTALTTQDAVDIALSNDIEDIMYFEVPEGKTVNIDGDYTLRGIDSYGKGTLNVSVKKIAAGVHENAVYLSEGITANITVTDGICVADTLAEEETSNPGTYTGYAYSAVVIDGVAQKVTNVTINGDIYGGNGKIPDAAYTDPSSYCDAGSALDINGCSKVTVNGDVYGGNSEGNYAYGASAIGYWYNDEDDHVDLTVNGDVYGGNVVANPDVDDDEFNTLGGTGINFSEYGPYTATVTVNGNVSGGSTNGANGTSGKAIAVNNTTIVVNGNLYAGDASGNGAKVGAAIGAYLSDVTVNGDVYGGDATGQDPQSGCVVEADAIVEGANTSDVSKIYIDGTVYVGKGEGQVAIGYTSDTIKVLAKSDLLLDYDEFINEGVSPSEIAVVALLELNTAYVEGIATDEDVSAILTDYYKGLADAIGFSLSADFEIAIDEHGEIVSTDEIDQLFEEIDLADQTVIEDAVVLLAEPMVDAYNEIIEENFDEDAELEFGGTPITLWAIDLGEDGSYAEIYHFVDFDGKEQAAENVFKNTVNYIVKVSEAQNGTVSADVETAKLGEKVTITTTPAEGYELDTVTADGLDQANGYTAKIGGGINISAAFKEKAPQGEQNNGNQGQQGNTNTENKQPEPPKGDDSLKSPHTSDSIQVYVVITAVMLLCVAAVVFSEIKVR